MADTLAEKQWVGRFGLPNMKLDNERRVQRRGESIPERIRDRLRGVEWIVWMVWCRVFASNARCGGGAVKRGERVVAGAALLISHQFALFTIGCDRKY